MTEVRIEKEVDRNNSARTEYHITGNAAADVWAVIYRLMNDPNVEDATFDNPRRTGNGQYFSRGHVTAIIHPV